MSCPKCNADNPATNKFCGNCGESLPQGLNAQSPDRLNALTPEDLNGSSRDDPIYYCARHKKELTRVRCGRCETPVCPRCAVYGPAGVRCIDCGRNRVPIRPRGVAHEAARALEGAAQNPCRTVWYLAIWGFILSIFTGIFGGHNDS